MFRQGSFLRFVALLIGLVLWSSALLAQTEPSLSPPLAAFFAKYPLSRLTQDQQDIANRYLHALREAEAIQRREVTNYAQEENAFAWGLFNDYDDGLKAEYDNMLEVLGGLSGDLVATLSYDQLYSLNNSLETYLRQSIYRSPNNPYSSRDLIEPLAQAAGKRLLTWGAPDDSPEVAAIIAFVMEQLPGFLTVYSSVPQEYKEKGDLSMILGVDPEVQSNFNSDIEALTDRHRHLKAEVERAQKIVGSSLRQQQSLEALAFVFNDLDEWQPIALPDPNSRIDTFVENAPIALSIAFPPAAPAAMAAKAIGSIHDGNYVAGAFEMVAGIGSVTAEIGSKLANITKGMISGVQYGAAASLAWNQMGLGQFIWNSSEKALDKLGVENQVVHDAIKFSVAVLPSAVVAWRTGGIIASLTGRSIFVGRMIGAASTPTEMAAMGLLTDYAQNEARAQKRESSAARRLHTVAETAWSSAPYSLGLMYLGRTAAGRAVGVFSEVQGFMEGVDNLKGAETPEQFVAQLVREVVDAGTPGAMYANVTNVSTTVPLSFALSSEALPGAAVSEEEVADEAQASTTPTHNLKPIPNIADYRKDDPTPSATKHPSVPQQLSPWNPRQWVKSFTQWWEERTSPDAPNNVVPFQGQGNGNQRQRQELRATGTDDTSVGGSDAARGEHRSSESQPGSVSYEGGAHETALGPLPSGSDRYSFVNIRSSFLRYVRGNITGREEGDALEKVAAELGISQATLNDREIRGGQWELENDVIALFSVAPEYRDEAAFQNRWGLDGAELLDTLIYYATVLDDFTGLEPQRSFARLRDLRVQEQIAADPFWRQRYDYYNQALIHKSVPEMAAELRVSESQVYSELTHLGLSIEQAFRRRPTAVECASIVDRLAKHGITVQNDQFKNRDLLAIARQLQDYGLSSEEIVESLNMGVQALAFIRHFLREEARGIGWDRYALFDESWRSEAAIAIALRGRGDTYAQIATALNQLFNTTDPRDPQYRTEAAVSAKLAEFGYRQSTATPATSDVIDPLLGPLKLNGRLQHAALWFFMKNHPDWDNARIATYLDVDVARIEEFRTRYFSELPSTRRFAQRHADQRRTVTLTINWIKAHAGKRPTATEFGIGEGKVGIPYDRLTGIDSYGKAGTRHDSRIFDSVAQYWLAVKYEANVQGVPLPLLDIEFKGERPPALMAIVQDEMLEKTLSWMAAHGNRRPGFTDFTSGGDGVGITYSRVVGMSDYRPGGRTYSARIFDSPEQFWLALKKKADANHVPLSLLDITARDRLPEFVALQQKEAVELTLKWIQEHDRTPETSDFGVEEGKVGINYQRLTAVGSYRLTTRSYDVRIFDSPEHFWLTVKREADVQGIPLSLLGVEFRGERSSAFIVLLQQEALAKVLSWVITHDGRRPTLNDFRRGDDRVDLTYDRLAGVGPYSVGKTSHVACIFDSPQQYRDALEKEIASFSHHVAQARLTISEHADLYHESDGSAFELDNERALRIWKVHTIPIQPRAPDETQEQWIRRLVATKMQPLLQPTEDGRVLFTPVQAKQLIRDMIVGDIADEHSNQIHPSVPQQYPLWDPRHWVKSFTQWWEERHAPGAPNNIVPFQRPDNGNQRQSQELRATGTDGASAGGSNAARGGHGPSEPQPGSVSGDLGSVESTADPRSTADDRYSFAKIKQGFLSHVRANITGREESDALEQVAEDLGVTKSTLNDRNIRGGQWELENDVIALFSVAPEYRDIDGFMRRWGLDQNELLDTLIYYATVLNDFSGLESQTAFQRLRYLRTQELIANNPIWRERYGYYRSALTHRSVPEMARERAISESEVYHELAFLGLSIESAFRRNPTDLERTAIVEELERRGITIQADELKDRDLLTIARKLRSYGLTSQEIVETLNLGEQAVVFIRHYLGEEHRSVGWDRYALFDESWRSEAAIVIALRGRGDTYAQIAVFLNQLFHTNDPSHSLFRTEQSVRHKLNDMGYYRRPQSISSSDVMDPLFGLLKLNDRLQHAALWLFIKNHPDYNDERIAEYLGVDIDRINDFRRFYFDFPDVGATPSRQLFARRYQDQRTAVDRTLQWITDNHGKIPRAKDFALGPGKVGITYDRLTGYGRYAPTGEQHEARIFDSLDQYWIAVKKTADVRDLPLSLLEIPFRGERSPELTALLQKEAVEKTLQWIHDHEGKTPTVADYGTSKDRVGVSYGRLTGAGLYERGRGLAHSLVFDSAEQYWLAVKREADARGQPLSLLGITFQGERSPELTAQLQNEVVDRTLQWMKDHEGRRPVQTEFGIGEGKVGFNLARAIGRGRYSPDREFSSSRIFDSTEQYWLAVKRAVDAQGLTLSLLDIPFQGERSPELADLLQKEAVEKTLRWITDHDGRIPYETDYGFEPRQIGIAYNRMTGTGNYGPSGRFPEARVFDSKNQYWLAVRNAADAQGMSLPLFDVPFRGERSPELTALLQRDAVEMTLQWMKDHDGRRPIITDYGSGEGQVGIKFDRLTGTSIYGPGKDKNDSRIFDSTEQYWLAVKREADARGQPLSLLEIPFQGERTPELITLLQKEAIEKTLQWIKEHHGRRPKATEVKSEIGMTYERIVGVGGYAVGGQSYHRRIFDSTQQFWTAVEAEAEKQGTRLEPRDPEPISGLDTRLLKGPEATEAGKGMPFSSWIAEGVNKLWSSLQGKVQKATSLPQHPSVPKQFSIWDPRSWVKSISQWWEERHAPKTPNNVVLFQRPDNGIQRQRQELRATGTDDTTVGGSDATQGEQKPSEPHLGSVSHDDGGREIVGSSSSPSSGAVSITPFHTHKERFLYFVRRLNLGLIDGDALQLTGTEAGMTAAELNRPNVEGGFWEFENDVLQLFLVAPELRAYDLFLQKWALNREELQDFMIYYASIFDDYSGLDPKQTVQRLKTLRAEVLIAKDPYWRDRNAYYQEHLLHLSAPEIASDLGVAESVVYSELSYLGISISALFHRQPEASELVEVVNAAAKLGITLSTDQLKGRDLLAIASHLHRLDVGQEQIVEILDLGDQALDFFLHYIGAQSRSIAWERWVEFEGEFRREVEVLLALKRRGLNDAVIAGQLNILFGTTDPTSALFRTESSVSGKLIALGEVKHRTSDDQTVIDPIFGILKLNGRLQHAALWLFIHSNPNWSVEQIADYLQEPVERIAPLVATPLVGAPKPGKRPKFADRYQEQRNAITKTLQWIRDHSGQLPGRADFGYAEGKIGVTYDRCMATSKYGLGEPMYNSRTFDSTEQFWLALRTAGLMSGQKIELIDVPFHKEASTQMRQIWQEEAIERTLKWIKDHEGRLPAASDFGRGEGKVGVGYDRCVALEHYALGQLGSRVRIFDSTEQFWLAVRAAGQVRGQIIAMLDIPLVGQPSVQMRQIWQEEAIERTLKWIKDHDGRLPKESDFDFKKEGSVRLTYDRCMGRGRYAPGDIIATRIFDSVEQFWLAVHAKGQMIGQRVELVDLNFLGVPSTQLRQIWQQDVIGRTLEWIKNHHRLPLRQDFGRGEGKVGIDYTRCTGKFSYAIGGETYAYRIFDSPEQYWSAVREEAARRGIRMSAHSESNSDFKYARAHFLSHQYQQAA